MAFHNEILFGTVCCRIYCSEFLTLSNQTLHYICICIRIRSWWNAVSGLSANCQEKDKLENVFVKHCALNHMPDPKGEWSLKENNSELHYGIHSKVNQFMYTLVCNYMPNIRILAKAVLQIFCSQGCSNTKCLCQKKGSTSTQNLRNMFKS